ncbi:MAG: vWA domain-containing protein [Planctomycetia bacterium]
MTSESHSAFEDVTDEPDGASHSPVAVPSWAVSLVLHVAVLLALALVVLDPPPKPLERLVLTQPPFEEPSLIETVDVAVSDAPPEAIGAEGDQGSEAPEMVAPEIAEVPIAEIESVSDVASDIQIEPLSVLPTSLTISKPLVVKGTISGVGTSGAAGAVDRLAAEINGYLEQRSKETKIYWLFDQSVSLAGQRKDIADRLERVFDELGVSHGGPTSKRLSHVVVGFGKDVTPITKKPTHDCSEVVEAIRSIAIDESGIERTFTAIMKAAQDARISRTSVPKKNVLIIAFSDEVGNDEQDADKTSEFCRRLGIPVYVVGVPAPFGQRQVKMKFVEPDPQYDQSEGWAVVEQGPETLYPEVVRIVSGAFAHDAIDSGFGPFSLSKFCAATGGLYFAVHANRETVGRVSDRAVAPMAAQLRRFFDSEVMRFYAPEYRTAAEIDQMLQSNQAKRALVDAARASVIHPMESPTMIFPRKDDAELVRLLGLAQRDAAVLQTKIDAAHATLAKGLTDRSKIKEKRWQAGYDLAMGRVLALKVRTYAYNSMLGGAKSGKKFTNPDSDTWRLVPSNDLAALDSPTQKLAKQAREFLERVIAEHPGTPWALLAADELETPLAYAWEERHTGVNEKDRPGDGNANPNRSRPKDDQKRKLAPPKPRRDLKNV